MVVSSIWHSSAKNYTRRALERCGIDADQPDAAVELLLEYMNVFAAIGRLTLRFFKATGHLFLFTSSAVAGIFYPPFYLSLIVQQIMRIGYYSLPVVGLTAFFTGGVLALQIYVGSNRYGAETFVPQIVVLGITRELGPVIAALMVTGRVAASVAAEIGTMRVTEQIDALTTLSTNPIKYLVVPRLIAAVFTMPLLVAIADSLGVFGGYIIATRSLGFTGSVYLKNSIDFVTREDVVSGLIKAAVFGFIIAMMGCYHGFNSRGGARGVGTATTNAVVAASVLVLAANYVLTSLIFPTK